MNPIPNYPGYFASIDGTVYTTGRRGKPLGKYPPKCLSVYYRNGYKCVKLWKDGQRTTCIVGRLVLEAFVGPPPEPDTQARHLNDLRHDNRLSNLAWGSPEVNGQDKTALVAFLKERYPHILEEFSRTREQAASAVQAEALRPLLAR